MTKTYDIATMPLTWRHYWIVFVASLGQLIGTGVATVSGIIIPMLNLWLHPELSGFMQGLIGAADLIGICIGSVLFGKLSDRYGYLFFFRLCPALICIAGLIPIFIPHVAVLTVCLFIVGIGIGGEYSLDSGYVSELMPLKYRSLMVGVTKTASALGNIIAAAVSFAIVIYFRNPSVWPDLMWFVVITGAVMFVLRIWFHESPGWLISKGKYAQAKEAVREFLGNNVDINIQETLKASDALKGNLESKGKVPSNLFKFIAYDWKKVVLTGIPWACEGLGVYGIGVFLPILVMALGLEHFAPGEAHIMHVASSVKVTLYISCIMLPGFICGLILIRRKYRLTLIQSVGFLLCALSLGVLMPAYELHWNKWIAIGAFMFFEFFLNMGPHLITYVLPPKVYMVNERGLGVGIAAAVGKIGAVLGVFVIPLLLEWGGAILVLGVSTAVMLIGAAVTFLLRKVGYTKAPGNNS